MPWVKTSDDLNEHPKIIQAGPLAELLYRRGITYANRYLTDGFLSFAVVENLVHWGAVRLQLGEHEEGPDSFIGPPVVEPDNLSLAGVLVECGLWEAKPEGFAIHDYHDYQPKAEEVRRLRKIRADAGRQGGIKSGVNRRSKTQAKPNPVPVPVPVPVSQNQSTAQTPPEVVKVKEIPRDDLLSADERHAMTTAGLVIKAIERLELSANGDRFQPGQWWGHSRKEKRRIVPMLATLEQLRRRLEAKDRPASPWAYCEATYEEKRASYWAGHAEREQAARKKEPAAPIVADLLSAAGAPGSKIGGG